MALYPDAHLLVHHGFAGALPEQYRQSFVDGFASMGGSFSGAGGSVPVPDGVPADVADAISSAGSAAFGTGFAQAAGDTMLLVAGVLVVGLVSGVLMRRESGHV